MTDEIDLSNICSREQLDNTYFAIQNLLDKLVNGNVISQYFQEELLTKFNCAGHSPAEQKEAVQSICTSTGIMYEDVVKEVNRITALNKRRKINKAFDEILPELKIDHYMDNAIAFYKLQPYFYDKQELFWFWKGDRWERVDDVEVERTLDKTLGFMGQTVSSSIRNSHLTAMKWYGREKQPKPAKPHWIQFKDKAFTLTKKKVYNVTPDYFFTNPIPWEIGGSDETPTMDKLFMEWVGPKYVKTLYELIAYCCYPSYPIQVLFCLYGHGRNGKSCFLRLLAKFIGQENICSTELDLLTGVNSSRFESSKLYKKLVCQMGETNFGILNKSSILKRLTGGDLMGFEIKGKNPFDEYNYAKIIIASNSLPMTEDTSDGYMRRWCIIDYPNEFPEGRDIVADIPDIEYRNLAKKCVTILPDLLKAGQFTNQGTIEERKKRYIMASNPFILFVNECCERDASATIKLDKFYSAYVNWLEQHKRRVIKSREFNTILQMEGIEIIKTSVRDDAGNWINGRFVYGFRFCAACDGYAQFPTQKNLLYRLSGKDSTSVTSVTKQEEIVENQPKIITFSIYDIITDIFQNNKQGISFVELLKNVEKQGINEDQLMAALAKMKEQGQIFEPIVDFYKLL